MIAGAVIAGLSLLFAYGAMAAAWLIDVPERPCRRSGARHLPAEI